MITYHRTKDNKAIYYNTHDILFMYKLKDFYKKMSAAKKMNNIKPFKIMAIEFFQHVLHIYQLDALYKINDNTATLFYKNKKIGQLTMGGSVNCFNSNIMKRYSCPDIIEFFFVNYIDRVKFINKHEWAQKIYNINPNKSKEDFELEYEHLTFKFKI